VRQAASATSAVEGFRLKASEIGNIVNFITSISHQTHLLAINAAIEAARAGEDGRGFGVVAEEVGGLADDVRRFAERISSLSDEITEGASDVADEIGKSAGSAQTLREVVACGATALDGILTAIRATADRVGEINELVVAQRRAAAEVNQNLESISGIAARNVAGTEEATSATGEQVASARKMTDSARQLELASEQLTSLVAVFRLH
jgi:methyl-accepting chemotaxis protein